MIPEFWAIIAVGASVLGVGAVVIGSHCSLHRDIDAVRRDLTAQITAVNTRIDNILLANRKP